jgi:proteic killer suppression protein
MRFVPHRILRAGHWAVTVQANWRVMFRFEAGDVLAVDYLDYH